MSVETLSRLLADSDWMELIWPILLMVFYGVASLVKVFAERTKKSKESDALPSSAPVSAEPVAKPRYKPLEEAARPHPETPQARTLPYARTAAKTGPSAAAPMPAAQPAASMSEWDRQQELKRRRLEQIEALRRQQLLEQQRQQIQQKAALQEQREQRQRAQSPQRSAAPPARPQSSSSGVRPTTSAPVAAAIRKTPQEALRQVQKGGVPVGAISSRQTVLRKSPVPSAKTVVQSAKEPSRPESVTSASNLLRVMLRRRETLRSAIVLKEILDVPVGMRNR